MVVLQMLSACPVTLPTPSASRACKDAASTSNLRNIVGKKKSSSGSEKGSSGRLKDDFADRQAQLEVRLGGREILGRREPGKTAECYAADFDEVEMKIPAACGPVYLAAFQPDEHGLK